MKHERLTPEAAWFAAEMARRFGAADNTRLEMYAVSTCQCGCGRPKGIAFKIGGEGCVIHSPEAVAVLVTALIGAYEELWGPIPDDE